MTNWKTCKIIKKNYIEHKNCFGFVLDGIILFHKNGADCYIDCANSHPFNTFQEGDYIEINLDRVEQENMYYVFNDINVVRKISLSTVVSSSSGGLTISTTPSSAAEVARTVTQTMMDQAERTGADVQCQIEQNTGNVNLFYRPKK